MTERYKSPHPMPTPRQAEILIVLIEECSEVIKEATKMLRFGLDTTDPHDPASPPGRLRLSTELGHVLCMASMCTYCGLADDATLKDGASKKAHKVEVHFQTEPDPVEPAPEVDP